MILVTGGTGLAGAAVTAEFLRRGRGVAVLSRNAARVHERFPDGQIVAREGDVQDVAGLTDAFSGIETVVNCVQFPNSPIENKRKGWTFEQVDYNGTLNQLEAAKAAGVQRFVSVSAVGADSNGDKHWFRFKGLADQAIRASGLRYVIIRPTWLYGPNDVALNRFVGFARRLRFVPSFGDGRQPMQPLFVDDLGRIVADALETPAAEGQTIEAGGPDRLSMDEVIRTALDVADARRPIVHQPVWLGKLLATGLQFLPGPPLTPDAIDFVTHEAVADNTALEQIIAPRLTPLRQGLASYLSASSDR